MHLCDYLLLHVFLYVIAEKICVCVCVSFSLSVLVLGYLGWFHDLSIVNRAALNRPEASL